MDDTLSSAILKLPVFETGRYWCNYAFYKLAPHKEKRPTVRYFNFVIQFMDQQPPAMIPAPVTTWQHTSADFEQKDNNLTFSRHKDPTELERHWTLTRCSSRPMIWALV